ncbi:NAC domain-containing protein 72 [Brachypodium distachyon]|uniref:NAC domain-containing protein n=1 Tax=Brachypodium distachyon TaxID=15368 RepID=A0A0Q3GNX3_BRADI|nr:NAC domain-containing protein 72 [Brachypodium distachyon]KQK12133.1 hypothetical protein BRADI_1g01801v3 [Brachypodium distachyon]|eukprot:XP_010229408.1 NAC domain-containing protein 72 [Brachypodium distachyon]
MAAGVVFTPSDHDLVVHFLRPRIAGADVFGRGRFFHDADVYSAAPADLVHGRDHAPGTNKLDSKGMDRSTWYFFSPAQRLQTKSGRVGGRRQGGEKPVLDSDGRRVGYMRKLSFLIKKTMPGEPMTRVGWCMTEYEIDGDEDRLVLCKVYRSRSRSKNTETASMVAGSKKRKAADDDELYALGVYAGAADAANQHKNVCRRQEMPPRIQEIETMGGAEQVRNPSERAEEDDGRAGGGRGCDEDDGRFECKLEELLGGGV